MSWNASTQNFSCSSFSCESRSSSSSYSSSFSSVSGKTSAASQKSSFSQHLITGNGNSHDGVVSRSGNNSIGFFSNSTQVKENNCNSFSSSQKSFKKEYRSIPINYEKSTSTKERILNSDSNSAVLNVKTKEKLTPYILPAVGNSQRNGNTTANGSKNSTTRSKFENSKNGNSTSKMNNSSNLKSTSKSKERKPLNNSQDQIKSKKNRCSKLNESKSDKKVDESKIKKEKSKNYEKSNTKDSKKSRNSSSKPKIPSPNGLSQDKKAKCNEQICDDLTKQNWQKTVSVVSYRVFLVLVYNIFIDN